MSSMILGRALVKPGAAAPGRRAATSQVRVSPRRLIVSASSAEKHGVTGRRQALAASVLSVGLCAGNAVFAEMMLESPEATPNAIIMEESVAADPVVEDVLEVEAAEVAKKEIEETVNEVVVEGGDSSASSASSDPLVLGGVAVAIGATVGAAAAMSQNSEESTPVEVAVTSGIDKASKLKELVAAREERNERHAALAALHVAVAKASEVVSKASVAHGAAFEGLITASKEASVAEFEAQKAQMEYDEAKAAFDEVAAKTGLSKMMMGLFGSVSMEDLEFDATDAEFKTRSTTVLAREAALSDRRAWIASWRAADALALATWDFQTKNAELGVIAALVHEADRNVETIKSELEIVEDEVVTAPAKAEVSSAASKQAGTEVAFIAKGLAADAWRGEMIPQIMASAEPAPVKVQA